MAAAPQYGQMMFRSLATGKTYSIDMYASDVVDTVVNLDSGAGASATSGEFWITPEDVTLFDVFIHTGMTDTTKVRLTSNGRPTTHIIRYAAALDTSDARPKLLINFRAGTQIAGIQLA